MKNKTAISLLCIYFWGEIFVTIKASFELFLCFSIITFNLFV